MKIFIHRRTAIAAGLVMATACRSGHHASPSPLKANSAMARPPVPGAPSGVTAFVNVAVVPMDTERVLLEQTVLVQNGRIAALGPSHQVPVPASATQIDGRGKFLIPGLSDMHVHLGASAGDADDTSISADDIAKQRLLLWLADGVTVVRNLDYMDKGLGWLLNGKDVLSLRAGAAAGQIWSPRIYTAGQWAPRQYTNFYRGPYRDSVATAPKPKLDSVMAYVAAYKALGYDVLKVHDERPEIFNAVLAAARHVGIPVVGHVRASLQDAFAGEMQSIEHMTGYPGDAKLSAPEINELVAASVRAGVWNCVTVRAGGGGSSKSGRPELMKAMYDGGAKLLLGSDWPLGKIHRELEALVTKVGFTPYQALVMGTTNPAMYFNALDESGTITVGKRADLVLLNDNPLTDIRHAAQPAGVMIGGRWLLRAELATRIAALKGTIH